MFSKAIVVAESQSFMVCICKKLGKKSTDLLYNTI